MLPGVIPMNFSPIINETLQIPETYQKNLQRAIEILKNEGCTEIFLFGSLAAKNIRKNSDIDIAIRGCPKGKFFHLLGKLLLELDYPVDLVNLESQDAFAQHLAQQGNLIQIG
jgi:predicted nucleotidyltransferase